MPYVYYGGSYYNRPHPKKQLSFPEAVNELEFRRDQDKTLQRGHLYHEQITEVQFMTKKIEQLIAQVTREVYIKKRGEEDFNKALEDVTQMKQVLKTLPNNVQGKLKLAIQKAYLQLTDFREIGYLTFNEKTKTACRDRVKKLIEESEITNFTDYLLDLNLNGKIEPQIEQAVANKYKWLVELSDQKVDACYEEIVKKLAQIPTDLIDLEVLDAYTSKN